MSYTIRCKDGRRWKVREAVSLKAACNAVAHARVTGSTGHKDIQTEYLAGRLFHEWPVTVLADVIQINSDNTERQAYQPVY